MPPSYKNKQKKCPTGTIRNLGDCTPRVSILISNLNSGFSEFIDLLHFNKDLFFNIYDEVARQKCVKHLTYFAYTALKNIFKPIHDFVKLKQFQPANQSATNLWTPNDIMAVLKKFQQSSNKNDLSPLKHIVQNLKNRIDLYVKKNIQNVHKLVIDENSPHYKEYPQWDEI